MNVPKIDIIHLFDCQSTRCSIFGKIQQRTYVKLSVSKQVSEYYHCIVFYYFFQPPLVQACFHGDAVEVRTLISRKEDVNRQVNTLNIFLLFSWQFS